MSIQAFTAIHDALKALAEAADIERQEVTKLRAEVAELSKRADALLTKRGPGRPPKEEA